MKNMQFAYLSPMGFAQDMERLAAAVHVAVGALPGDNALSMMKREGGVALAHSPKRSNLEIGDIVTALTLVASVALECPCMLTWIESDVSVQGTEAAKLLEQWRDERRPPVLSIVRLAKIEIGNGRVAHRTRGVTPFVGHELMIEIDYDDDPINALKALVTLAGYALVLGPEYRLRPIYDAAGRAAHFTQTPDPETGMDVVKIEF